MPIISRYHTSLILSLLHKDYPIIDLFDLSTQKTLKLIAWLLKHDVAQIPALTALSASCSAKLDKIDTLDQCEQANLPANNYFTYEFCKVILNLRGIPHVTSSVKRLGAALRDSLKLSQERFHPRGILTDQQLEESPSLNIKSEMLLYKASIDAAYDDLSRLAARGSTLFLGSLSDEFKRMSIEELEYTLSIINPAEITRFIDWTDYLNKIRNLKGITLEGHWNWEVLPIGPLIIFSNDNFCIPLNLQLIQRSRDFISAIGNICVSYDYFSPGLDPIDFKRVFLDLIFRLSDRDPEMVGEWIKATRNYMINTFDRSNLLGQNMANLLLGTYDSEKVAIIKECYETILSITNCKRSQLNLTYLYKVVPHPDTDLFSSFNKLQGLYEPNKVDPTLLQRFEGTLRRAIFVSMCKSGIKPRIIEGSLRDDTLKAGTNLQGLRSIPADIWAEQRFDLVPQLPRYADIPVPISNKSSSKETKLPIETLEKLKQLRLVIHARDQSQSYLREHLSQITSTNDIESELKGEELLSPERSREKLLHIIKAHELFERQYPDIDEIPTEDYRQFYEQDPDAFCNVGTEPKFGEKHKKSTRIFYMAEPSIKAYTQRVERLVRNICKRQYGVSITKGFSARRRDALHFCNTMTQSSARRYNIYISFDMSSFSMKFPMILLRIYGKILKELTGDDIYRRLDLIFKSSIVYNNTRSFFDYLIAPRGGFEGFFNFTWTSIHAAIMEMSLEMTGCPGDLLTFSDDGLLRISSSDIIERQSPRDTVRKIQETYRRLGLEFHLGKTLVSTNVWEYLGDICIDGSICESWCKELCSLSSLEEDVLFHPIADKVNALNGQAAACAKGGFSAIMACGLAIYYVFRTLNRFEPLIPVKHLLLLTIIPFSAGGFRVQSQYEMATSSNIPNVSEIIADFYVLFKYYPEEINAIVTTIIDKLREGSMIAEIFTTGTWIHTCLPDTSANGLKHRLLDKAREASNAEIPDNPITTFMKSEVIKQLKCTQDVDVDMFASLFRELPSVIEYENAMGMLNSPACLRLLNRSEIKKCQAKDTLICREAIEYWSSQFNYASSRNVSNISPFKILDQVIRINLHGLKVKFPKPALRIMLRAKGDEYMRVGTDLGGQTISSASKRRYNDLVVPEIYESEKFREIEVLWSTGKHGNDSSGRIKRFCNHALRFVFAYPAMQPVVENISRLFGYNINPNLVLDRIGRNIERRTANKLGVGDVRVFCNKVLKNRSTYWILGYALYLFNQDISLDRSTYPNLVKFYHCQCLQVDQNLDNKIGKNIERTYYIDRNQVNHFHRPIKPMLIKSPKRIQISSQTKADKELQQLLEVSIDDMVRELDTEDLLIKITTPEGIDDEWGHHLLKEYAIQYLSNQLCSYLLMPRYSVECRQEPIPEMVLERVDILSSAIIYAAIKSLHPSCYASINDFLHSNYMGSIDYKRDIGKKLDPHELLQDYILILLNYCIQIYHTVIDTSTLNHVTTSYSFIAREISQYQLSINLFSNDITPTFVVVAPTELSRDKILPNNIKRALQAFSANVRDSLHRDWSGKDVKRLLPQLHDYSIDDLLDIVTIAPDIIRTSQHRNWSEPFNLTMARMYSVKLHVCHSLLCKQFGKHKKGDKDEQYEAYIAYLFNRDSFIHNIRANYPHLNFILDNRFGPDHKRSLNQYPSSKQIKRIIDRFKYSQVKPLLQVDPYNFWSNISDVWTSFSTSLTRSLLSKIRIVTRPDLVENFAKDSKQKMKLEIAMLDEYTINSHPFYIPTMNDLYQDAVIWYDIKRHLVAATHFACKSGIIPYLQFDPAHYQDLNHELLSKDVRYSTGTKININKPKQFDFQVMMMVETTDDGAITTYRRLMHMFIGHVSLCRALSHWSIVAIGILIHPPDQIPRFSDLNLIEEKDDDEEKDGDRQYYNNYKRARIPKDELLLYIRDEPSNMYFRAEVYANQGKRRVAIPHEIENDEHKTDSSDINKVMVQNILPEEIEDRPWLGLASIVATASLEETNASIIYAYAAFNMDMAVLSDSKTWDGVGIQDQFKEYILSVTSIIHIMKTDSIKAKAISVDMQMVDQWLRHHPINSNSPDKRLLFMLYKRVPQIGKLPNVYSVTNINRGISVREYLKRQPPKPEIGKLSDELYPKNAVFDDLLDSLNAMLEKDQSLLTSPEANLQPYELYDLLIAGQLNFESLSNEKYSELLLYIDEMNLWADCEHLLP